MQQARGPEAGHGLHRLRNCSMQRFDAQHASGQGLEGSQECARDELLHACLLRLMTTGAALHPREMNYCAGLLK